MKILPRAALLLCVATTACSKWQPESGPVPAVVEANSAGAVRVGRTAQPAVVIRHPTLDGDSIVGSTGKPATRVAIPVGDVEFIQSKQHDPGKTTLVFLGSVLLAGLVAVATFLLSVHTES